MEFKLTYFPAKGRAETIRLMFAAAGQKFEDERITGDAWAAFKPKTPMKSMPVLTVKGDGKEMMVCQSTAIARYLAKKFGLYGSNPWEDLLIDEVVDSINDMISELVKWFVEKDEEKKAELLKSFGETIVPKFIEYFRLRKKEGRNGYIVGSKLSLADIALFSFVDQQKSFGQNPFEAYNDIMEHYDLVKSNSRIAEYLKNRPES